MLTTLSIRNIVLIESLDLDFARGLGVLTGETGAGKSILLDALGLVLGARGDAALIRGGEEAASATATFEFEALPEALSETLDEAGVEVEPGEPLIVRRQLSRKGDALASKAFVNGQPVGVAVLRAIAPVLVELHGQHDDRGLVNPRGHRALLSRFAGADEGAVARAWHDWRAAEDALADAEAKIAAAQEEQDLLLAHLEELTALNPMGEGEEAELAGERADMQKGERLSGDLEELRHVFAGSKGAVAQLRGAARKLERIAEEHEYLAAALSALDRAIVEGDDAEEALNRAADALLYDPQRLDEAEKRLFDLRAAARKHDCTVDELPAKAAWMREQLDDIEHGSARLVELKKAAREKGDAYRARAEELSAKRVKAGARLDKAVAAELKPLRLDNASFHASITRMDEDKWGPAGLDAIEFLISTNPGAPLAPLAKIASGGELSRFILALKVALAEEGGAAVIIFDEIDRGVGGAVSSAIGERLARLAASGQLLAVTHSPQVAARGNTHYVIAKSSKGLVTRTSVTRLDADGRQEEIARMLSGAQVTDEARAQAEKLLEGV